MQGNEKTFSRLNHWRWEEEVVIHTKEIPILVFDKAGDKQSKPEDYQQFVYFPSLA